MYMSCVHVHVVTFAVRSGVCEPCHFGVLSAVADSSIWSFTGSIDAGNFKSQITISSVSLVTCSLGSIGGVTICDTKTLPFP